MRSNCNSRCYCLLCVQHWYLEDVLKLFKLVILAFQSRKYDLGSLHLKSLYFWLFCFPFSVCLFIAYLTQTTLWWTSYLQKGSANATVRDDLPKQVGETSQNWCLQSFSVVSTQHRSGPKGLTSWQCHWVPELCSCKHSLSNYSSGAGRGTVA